MKKRCILGILGLCLVLLLTGCEAFGAKGSALEGQWEATWDLKKILVESMGEELADYADCFEDISIKMSFDFSNDKVELKLNENSIEEMGEALEESCGRLIDAIMEDAAAELQISVGDVYALMGTTREAYLKTFLENVNLDSIIGNLTKDMETTVKYKLDEEEGIIFVTYAGGDKGEWEYEFNEDELTIVFEIKGVKLEFECERKGD